MLNTSSLELQHENVKEVDTNVSLCETPTEGFTQLPVDLFLQAAALINKDSRSEFNNNVKKSTKRPCKVSGCMLRSARYGLCGKHGGKERCKHPGCEKFEYKAGLCQLHGGPKWRYKKPCLAAGCELAAYRRGLCSRHGGVDKCSVPGCDKNDRGGGYCMAHRGDNVETPNLSLRLNETDSVTSHENEDLSSMTTIENCSTSGDSDQF